MAPAIMGNPERPELGAFLTNSFCATDPEVAREFARVTFFSDNRADLAKLNIDSLTLQCTDDMVVSRHFSTANCTAASFDDEHSYMDSIMTWISFRFMTVGSCVDGERPRMLPL